MLKWLKQKPTGPHLRGGSEGSQEVAQNKIITDDPLATIQVHHPQQKKSKNKSEEIYAVSRVNPLFEEEDVPKVIVGGANNSGSSGYDSGSQTQSDDDDPKYPQRRSSSNSSGNDAASTSSTSSFSVLSRAPPKHGQLFRDEDDPVVHHQAAILAENGRPVLHIVEQNPDYVQSIAVSLGGGRVLIPNPSTQLRDAKTSVHPVPARAGSSGDNLGLAKLLHKEPRYVHSIVIGAQQGKSATLSSVSRSVQSQSTTAAHAPSSPAPAPISKKPSVTFSERVELVAPNRENGKVVIKGEVSTSYRKPSSEPDSIVTESLLLLTSSNSKPPIDPDKGSSLLNASKTNSNHSSKSQERKVSSSSNESASGVQKIEDLEALSSSIRKNHPIKHILSNSGKSLEITQAADHYSNDYGPTRSQRQGTADDESSSCGSEGQGHSYDEDTSTTGSSSNGIVDDEEGKRNCRRSAAGPCSKSPFGGIADHYAAAKEIAKEIESYSNGSAKTSSKKSIVRDLLSGRGREALAFHTAIRRAALESQQKSGFGKEAAPRHAYPLSNDAIDEWESVRVQQVYLKGRSWKPVESSDGSRDGPFSPAGQRVVSVTHLQGQVHPKQKDTIRSNSTSTIHSLTQPSSSSSKQQCSKNAIYNSSNGNTGDGSSPHHEAEDASSDSGNSTDRNSKGSREELPERRTASRQKPPSKPPDPSQPSDPGSSGGGLSSPVDKVMIVTGDSQNMVVDLSGVPQDLRDAIISGTALITLPDGLKSASSKKGGYTIISLPTNSTPQSNATYTSSSSSPSQPPHSGKLTGNHKRLQLEEDEIRAAPLPSTSMDINVNQLERGELYDHIFNSYKYGSKNKSQIWNVMQQSVQQTLIEGKNGKKKKITTVLPFHPNQDVYQSPDFTMEGQRLERQRKKLDLAKKRRCVCRLFGILFFLTAFIGILVALSMIYTKGQRYFGSV